MKAYRTSHKIKCDGYTKNPLFASRVLTTFTHIQNKYIYFYSEFWILRRFTDKPTDEDITLKCDDDTLHCICV